MILDAYGNPLPVEPSPYDAILAEHMRPTLGTVFATKAWTDDVFGYSRLVDECGHHLQCVNQVRMGSGPVVPSFTVKPRRHPEDIQRWAADLAADVCDAND